MTYNGFCPGGTALYDNSDYDAASLVSQMVNSMGAGNLDPQQLARTTMGKQAGSAVGMTLDASIVTGGGSYADLETALQLSWLQMTMPRQDSIIFNKQRNQLLENLKTQGVDPNSVFNDSIGYITGNYNYRFAPMTAKRLNQISMKRMFDIYRERFADASGFTFVFVGDFNVDAITPLLEQYLGSLPSTPRKNITRNLDIHAPRGVLVKKIYKGTEDKASVRIMLHDDYQYTALNNLAIKALGEILEVRIIQHLREQESEVYSPGVQSAYHKLPDSRYAYMINFGCAPKNVNHLVAMVEKDMKTLAEDGPDADDLLKFKAAYEKSQETTLLDNSFWSRYLAGQVQDGENILAVLNAKKDLEQLTLASLKEAAGKYLSGKNMITFELLPEETAK
ncbi:M16 family metallopeptidase [Pedobacter sp. AW31-3R]|uniref:M16 family metallopeptidase n=1 Tax=Pedobacter sp. AW31-3R TaxID=3445781 RepID=UPI003F9ECEBA